MRLKQQPKQSLDRSYNFHAGRPPSVLSCPPRHLSRHPQSLSVYTISGVEWTAAQGSPWEAVEAPPYPASHAPQNSLFPTASPNNNPTPARSVLPQMFFLLKHQLDPWESVFLFTPYLWQIPRPLWLHHSNNATLSAVLRRTCRLVLSAAVDLFSTSEYSEWKNKGAHKYLKDIIHNIYNAAIFMEILICTLVLNFLYIISKGFEGV